MSLSEVLFTILRVHLQGFGVVCASLQYLSESLERYCTFYEYVSKYFFVLLYTKHKNNILIILITNILIEKMSNYLPINTINICTSLGFTPLILLA